MFLCLCLGVSVYTWESTGQCHAEASLWPLGLVLFAVGNSPMWVLGAKFGSWAAPAQSQGEVSPTFAMLLFFRLLQLNILSRYNSCHVSTPENHQQSPESMPSLQFGSSVPLYRHLHTEFVQIFCSGLAIWRIKQAVRLCTSASTTR